MDPLDRWFAEYELDRKDDVLSGYRIVRMAGSPTIPGSLFNDPNPFYGREAALIEELTRRGLF